MNPCRLLQQTFVPLVTVFALAACGPQLDPAPPQPLDIGQTYVGTVASKTGTWRNSGTANATITQAVPTMGGANANLFAGALMGAVPATVAKGQALAPPAVFAFAPTDVGQFTATATPTVQEANARVSAMTLKGEGIMHYVVGDLTLGGQQIVLQPPKPVNFGRVRVGQQSPIITFDIQNGVFATQNITITKVQFSMNNQGFSHVGPPTPFVVPKGGKVAVQLRFRPPAFPNPPLEKMFRDGVTFFEVQTDTFGNITAQKSAAGVALCGVGFHPSEIPPNPPMTCP